MGGLNVKDFEIRLTGFQLREMAWLLLGVHVNYEAELDEQIVFQKFMKKHKRSVYWAGENFEHTIVYFTHRGGTVRIDETGVARYS